MIKRRGNDKAIRERIFKEVFPRGIRRKKLEQYTVEDGNSQKK